MFAYFRNCSLFNQLIVPMVVVGIIGVGAIIASAFTLQNSVEALGKMYSAGGERLKTLQDIDKGIANVRALSLKHLASESAQNMSEIRNDLGSVEQRLKTAIADHVRAPHTGDRYPEQRPRHLPGRHRRGHAAQRGIRKGVRIRAVDPGRELSTSRLSRRPCKP